ncbi:MAG: 3'-5' exonuclease, partial [Alphaproteobacteria bacterium]|nr:3'-5' exonuclease [Alphaproteobacteria bacterium]
RGLIETRPPSELAEVVLDESGYTAMWQASKDVKAPSKLENLKELIVALEPFDKLGGFLEHVSLVMDAELAQADDAVNILTLHGAKGLEFDTVFLPGWEDGLFPHQRALDENGMAALEEERRLAYVGLTRARERAIVSFAANRQMYGRWSTTMPSRFIEELPVEHIETELESGLYSGGSEAFGSHAEPYSAPGAFTFGDSQPSSSRMRRAPASAPAPSYIEGHAEQTVTTAPGTSDYAIGERVFHQKFGYGRIEDIEGNKLSIDFEKAGAKKVIDSFVDPT